MDHRDRERFATAMFALTSTFQREGTKHLLEGYRLGLAGLTIERIEQAVARALRQCRFMPSPAELRELAGEMNADHRAVLAWEAFRQAVHDYNYYDSVDFDDPLINATVRTLGGWERVSSIEDSSEFDKWLRKEFERTYKAYLATGASEEQRQPLLGYVAKQNALTGHFTALPRPRRIATGLPRAPCLPAPEKPPGPLPSIPGMKAIGQMPDAENEKNARTE